MATKFRCVTCRRVWTATVGSEKARHCICGSITEYWYPQDVPIPRSHLCTTRTPAQGEEINDNDLPYDQVCEIIEDVAADWVCDLSDYEPEANHYQQFGHTLWRALEEAHLAKQEGE